MKWIIKSIQSRCTGSKSCTPESAPVTPDAIIQLGHLFWPSRVLLTAIELDLFTKLAAAPKGRMTNPEIRSLFGLHRRATPDFTDALVAMGMLARDGSSVNGGEETCEYYNTPETGLFLNKNRDSYVGDILERCATKFYRDWIDHGELLKDKSRKTQALQEVVKACNQQARVKVFQAGRIGSSGTSEAEKKLSPSKIFDMGFGFWSSRLLLTAIEWRLFTKIEESENRRMTADEIRKTYSLRKSTTSEFLDTLVSLHMLQRAGDAGTKSAVYFNTPEGSIFLDRNKTSYVGAIMEMVSKRGYCFWADLTEALQTGEAQNENKSLGMAFYDMILALNERVEEFQFAMLGIQHGCFTAFAEKFDFRKYKTMVDIGGGTGQLSCYVAQRHPHMKCITTDLPQVEPIAKRWIEKWGCQKQVKAITSDFQLENFPKADVITMGMILHDYNLETKLMLIRKAYDALPPGGALVSIETVIDDDRRSNVMGLMMSLHMLIEFGSDGGFDFTGSDFNRWCLEVGFKRTKVVHLLGPSSAAIAIK